MVLSVNLAMLMVLQGKKKVIELQHVVALRLEIVLAVLMDRECKRSSICELIHVQQNRKLH